MADETKNPDTKPEETKPEETKPGTKPAGGKAGYRAIHLVKGSKLFEAGEAIPAGELSKEQAAKLIEQGVIEKA